MEGKIDNIIAKIKNDAKIANYNYKKFDEERGIIDNRIKIMANRFEKFNSVLKNILTTNQFVELREYVQEIYDSIKWDKTNLTQDEIDMNIDYKTFINYIYAFLSNNTVSYDISFEQKRYQEIYENILENINLLTNED